MMSTSDTGIELRQDGVYDIVAPATQTMAAVFASPHSGSDYIADFLKDSKLDLKTLRRSEDCFMDQVFGGTPTFGAPLIRALFPRAFVDPNREPFELDPEMFEDPLPDYANCHSQRVAGGIGTIARVVASGEEIYARKLRFADVASRINTYYRPYHRALQRLIETTRARFGHCLLVDCHSMPSIGGPMDRDPGRTRVDIVLGDAYGTACAPTVTARVDELFTGFGYRVSRNMPYSGGYTTVHYGRPEANVHTLQIEFNRAIYMDESRLAPVAGMAQLIAHVNEMIAMLKREWNDLVPAANPEPLKRAGE
jgi:N-formylglutamate amidohydrolase